MKIFCYNCKTEEETQWLVRCSKCDAKDIGIEKEIGWHKVSRLFFFSKGWQGDSDELSLPRWVEGHPQCFSEWQKFKSDLMNVEFPPLPEEFVEKEDIFSFWIRRAGVLSLQMGTEFELLHTPFIGDLVRTLATAYSNYYYHQRHGGAVEHPKQVEKEKPNLIEKKKKSLFPKRTKGREFKRAGR
jgi:hypothetical protein